MTKYDEEFKRRVVHAYLSGDRGYRALSLAYGVDRSKIRVWVENYRQHGDAGLRKKYSRYSADFKRSVLKRMWQEGLSCRQVLTLFDIRGGASVITRWERQYHEGGLEALKPKPIGRPMKMRIPELSKRQEPPEETRTLEQLRKENEYLRAEVAYLKKLDALVRAKQQSAQKKRKPSPN